MKQLLRIVGLALIAVIAGCVGTGETQSAEIAALLAADGWHAIAHHRDLTGRDRVTTARR